MGNEINTEAVIKNKLALGELREVMIETHEATTDQDAEALLALTAEQHAAMIDQGAEALLALTVEQHAAMIDRHVANPAAQMERALKESHAVMTDLSAEAHLVLTAELLVVIVDLNVEVDRALQTLETKSQALAETLKSRAVENKN